MFWFRVELDSKGVVLSSKKVAHVGERDGKPSVFYFEAATSDDAERKAFNEYHCQRLASRRELYKNLGKCRCGRDRCRETQAESAFATCPACRKLDVGKRERVAARAKGLTVAPPSKAERFVDRRKEEKRELLEIVLDQFQRMTMRQFGEWLNGQIAELTEKPAPKLRVVSRG